MMGSRYHGYILAGGNSKRFGCDKARVVLNGRPLLCRVRDMIQGSVLSVTCVAKTDHAYDDFGIHTIGDISPMQGPLGGIVTALSEHLREYGEGYCIIVSCDLGLIKASWLEKLEEIALAGGVQYDAVLFKENYWEPFPGFYHTSLLGRAVDALKNNEGSIQKLLNDVEAGVLGRPSDWPEYNQLNTMGQLEKFQKNNTSI